MSSYNKNSVKLLPTIENYQNNTVFYTEFDGKYDIGDKLHIMVLDENSSDYIIDSFNTSGNTNVGYELLHKDGNKLTLDIDYEELTLTGLTLSGITGLTESNCYIGKIYIKNGIIDRGIINDTMMYNIYLEPKSNFNITWKQGIIYSVDDKIKSINFDKKSENKLLLKSEILNGVMNSYYVEDCDELSIINLSKNHLELLECNISDGIFYNSELSGYLHTINGGKLVNCSIGPNYIINGGELIDSELYDITIKWNNGTWNSSWTSGNPFTPLIWENGVWKDGIFPDSTTWVTGRFLGGTFQGQRWNNGIFGYNDINREKCEAVFQNTIWENGIFNGGNMINSTWENGDFNFGKMIDTTWNDGNFNNGTISGTTYKEWKNGHFNGGTMEYMNWVNGNFNDGIMNNSVWVNGNFNNGLMDNSTWNDGNWFSGKFQNSSWLDGKFYNGSIFSSDWNDGELHFGILNDVDWSGGTWLNGVANNVRFYDGEWLNGTWNFGYFYKGNWYDGSFNSGYFSGLTSTTDATWYNGSFYFGAFDATWINGIFYTGDNVGSVIPPSDIIGKPYKQYNKGKLTNIVYTKDRLPAKKRY